MSSQFPWLGSSKVNWKGYHGLVDLEVVLGQSRYDTQDSVFLSSHIHPLLPKALCPCQPEKVQMVGQLKVLPSFTKGKQEKDI